MPLGPARRLTGCQCWVPLTVPIARKLRSSSEWLARRIAAWRRYDLAFNLQFNRALKHLLLLKSLPTSSPTEPYFPGLPVRHTWKDVLPFERTQEALENKES